jgi:nucleotide-binding universal stress UspA family protein
MYDDILIPADGSDPAIKAARHGFELARYHDATVHLLYVVDEPPPGVAESPGLFGEPGTTVYAEDVRAVLDEVATQTVDELAMLADGLDVEAATEVLTGDPVSRITRFADEEGIDLIVIGTQDRSGVDRLLHRSVTEAVLRRTPVPVLVLRSDEDAGDKSEAEPENREEGN